MLTLFVKIIYILSCVIIALLVTFPLYCDQKWFNRIFDKEYKRNDDLAEGSYITSCKTFQNITKRIRSTISDLDPSISFDLSWNNDDTYHFFHTYTLNHNSIPKPKSRVFKMDIMLYKSENSGGFYFHPILSVKLASFETETIDSFESRANYITIVTKWLSDFLEDISFFGFESMCNNIKSGSILNWANSYDIRYKALCGRADYKPKES